MVKTPRASVGNGLNGEAKDPSLYCLSYVSTQNLSLDQADLVALLERARDRNASLGITGLLLHRADAFFQVLEGGRDEVLGLFAKIKDDERHCRVEVVAEGPLQSREYNDWQMAFVELDGQDLSALPGFSDVMKNTPAAREFLAGLSRSKKLAMLFTVME